MRELHRPNGRTQYCFEREEIELLFSRAARTAVSAALAAQAVGDDVVEAWVAAETEHTLEVLGGQTPAEEGVMRDDFKRRMLSVLQMHMERHEGAEVLALYDDIAESFYPGNKGVIPARR